MTIVSLLGQPRERLVKLRLEGRFAVGIGRFAVDLSTRRLRPVSEEGAIRIRSRCRSKGFTMSVDELCDVHGVLC